MWLTLCIGWRLYGRIKAIAVTQKGRIMTKKKTTAAKKRPTRKVAPRPIRKDSETPTTNKNKPTRRFKNSGTGIVEIDMHSMNFAHNTIVHETTSNGMILHSYIIVADSK